MTKLSPSLSEYSARIAARKFKAKKCKQCEKMIYVDRRGRIPVAKFCSMKCSGAWHFRQEERTCMNCSKNFMFKPSQLNAYKNAGRYCSRNCRNQHDVKMNANKPTKDKWGRTRRKADVEWIKAVKDKYGNICQRCFKHFEVIHAHHIALRSHRPDLKHVVENGITLCGSCHKWVHHHPDLAREIGLINSESYVLAKKKEQLNGIS